MLQVNFNKKASKIQYVRKYLSKLITDLVLSKIDVTNTTNVKKNNKYEIKKRVKDKF